MINNFRALDMKALCERICENKTTLIVFHARPDGDAVGSAFALKDILDAMEEEEFNRRAFAWRKRKTIERNIDILDAKSK